MMNEGSILCEALYERFRSRNADSGDDEIKEESGSRGLFEDQ